MKKLILAASLLTTLAAVPAFAQGADTNTVGTPEPQIVTSAPREFTARSGFNVRRQFQAERSDAVQIDRNAVPSSAGPSSNAN